MKVTLIILLFLCSFANVTLADQGGNKPNTTVVSGVVIDQLTGEPLEGVKLIIGKTKQVVYTDNSGSFEFEKDVTEDIQLTAELISYEKLVVTSNSVVSVAEGDVVLFLSEVD